MIRTGIKHKCIPTSYLPIFFVIQSLRRMKRRNYLRLCLKCYAIPLTNRRVLRRHYADDETKVIY